MSITSLVGKQVNKSVIEQALVIQGIDLDSELSEAVEKIERNVNKSASDVIQTKAKMRELIHNFRVARRNGIMSRRLLNKIKSLI